MITKTYILILILTINLFAAYEQVKIGKIDAYYKNKLSKAQLEDIIKEIEINLETSTGLNLFDLKATGKAIDILYLPPSKLERRVKRKQASLKRKSLKIKKLRESFPSKEEKIDILKHEIDYKTTELNTKIEDLNEYIRTINKKRNFSKEEFNEVQKYIKSKRIPIKLQDKVLKKEQRRFRSLINSYNQKVHLFNSYTRDYNRMIKELESINRGFRKVKGKTFGIKEIETISSYKNGKKVKKVNIKNSMNKIEIYSFNNIEELKVILAHELLHLVGIPHINEKGALMNPLLQKEQLKKLSLSITDINNIKNNF